MRGSGRAVALVPPQRERGRIQSSIEQQPVSTERKVAAVGMEVGLMNVGPRTPNNQRTESYSLIVARYAPSLKVPGILGRAVIKAESNYQPNARGGAGENRAYANQAGDCSPDGLLRIRQRALRPRNQHQIWNEVFGHRVPAVRRRDLPNDLRYNAGHGPKRMNPVSAALCSKVKQALAAS